MLIKTEGIIIKSRDYGEGNKILTIYSPQMGKLSMMARGAKKPKSRLSASTQLFTYGSYLMQKGSPNSMGTLSQGEIIESHRELRQHLKLTSYAAYFTELLDKLVEEGEASSSLFQLLLTIFRYLIEEKDAEILARLFEMKMFMVSGYRPVVTHCVSCENTDQLQHFSIREGGILCNRCLHQDPHVLRVQPNTIKLLQLFYHIQLDRIGQINVKPETKKELEKIMWLFMDQHTPLRLKSRNFLEQMGDFLP